MNPPPENNEANSRTAIHGLVQNENENMLQVCYAAATGTVTKWVPKTCIANQQEVGDATLFLLQNGAVGESTVVVRDAYGDAVMTDAHLRNLADAWTEFGDLMEAESSADDEPEFEDIDDDEPEFEDIDDDEPEFEDIDDDDDDDDDEPTTEAAPEFEDIDDEDDSTPQFSGASVDLADIETDDDKVAKAKKSAAQKIAALKDSRYADAKEVTKDMNSDISKAMASGKRHADFGPWNFEPQFVELRAVIADPNTGKETYHEVTDGKGDARVRMLINPTLATKDNPLGAVLNRACGPNYAAHSHPHVFLPVIEAVEQLPGVSWDAFSFNQGGRGLLNVDFTNASATMRKDATTSLMRGVNLSANRMQDAFTEEAGGHRMGVSILNTLDGKGSLQGFVTCLRTYCTNLAVRGGVEALLMTAGGRKKVRHMQGAMATFDPEWLAERIAASFIDTQKHLTLMHVLRHVPVEVGLFDKLMTVFGSHGLVAQPTVSIKAGDLNSLNQDAHGNLILQAGDLQKQAVSIAGGHAYNAVMSGWMDSQVDYVALKGKDKEAEGTLFHAAQCITGTITHNPVWSDGKRILHGKTQGVDTLMKRSGKATAMLETIAANAVKVFSEYNDNQPVDDFHSMASFFAEKPEALIVPYSAKVNGKKQTVNLTNIPDYHETWSVKVVAEAKAE